MMTNDISGPLYPPVDPIAYHRYFDAREADMLANEESRTCELDKVERDERRRADMRLRLRKALEHARGEYADEVDPVTRVCPSCGLFDVSQCEEDVCDHPDAPQERSA